MNRKAFVLSFMVFLFALIIILLVASSRELRTTLRDDYKYVSLIDRVSTNYDYTEDLFLDLYEKVGNTKIYSDSNKAVFSLRLPDKQSKDNYDLNAVSLRNFILQDTEALSYSINLLNADLTTLNIHPFDINFSQADINNVRDNNSVFFSPSGIEFRKYFVEIKLLNQDFNELTASISSCGSCFFKIELDLEVRDANNAIVSTFSDTDIDANSLSSIFIKTNEPPVNDIEIFLTSLGNFRLSNNSGKSFDLNAGIMFPENELSFPEIHYPKGFLKVKSILGIEKK